MDSCEKREKDNCPYNEDNFDGDDFDDVEEDEGLDDLENAEEVSTEPWAPLSAAQAAR